MWERLWLRSGKTLFRHFDNPHSTLLLCVTKLKATSGSALFRPDFFFEERECDNLGGTIQTVKEIVQFPDKEVELQYNIGTRTNGVVELRWLNNLTRLIISLEGLVIRHNSTPLVLVKDWTLEVLRVKILAVGGDILFLLFNHFVVFPKAMS